MDISERYTEITDIVYEHKKAVLIVGLACVALFITGLFLFRTPDSTNESQSWERQKAQAEESAKALGQHKEGSHSTSQPSSASSSTLDAHNIHVGINDYDAYKAVADKRSAHIDVTDKIINTTFTWNSHETYMKSREDLLALGVPEKSQLLTVYMPELSDTVIDGVHYNKIDMEKLEKNLSQYSGPLGKKRIYQHGDKTIVSVHVASGGAKGSHNQHVLVRVSFNADDTISDVYAQGLGDVDEALVCLPIGCDGTSNNNPLVSQERNGGPSDA